MSPDEQMDCRFREWIKSAGSRGLVSVGRVVWLLGVSRSRVKTLVQDGRLQTVPLGGERMILFFSVLQYSKEAKRWRQHRQELLCAKGKN